MLVQCPKCKTTYKVADEVVKGSAPAFRCSRCKHTFELESPEAAGMPAEKTSTPLASGAHAAEDRELSFTFPAKEETEVISKDKDEFVETDLSARDAAITSIDNHDQWTLHRSETNQEPPFTMSATQAGIEEKGSTHSAKINPPEKSSLPAAQAGDETADNILPLASYMDLQASILPYMTLFGLLVICFALVAVISHAHPKASEDVAKNIPLLGASVLKNNRLKDGVRLQSLRASSQSIQGNREVFVITGEATNQNPVVIRAVQVAGQIYNEEGKPIEEQTTWIGNAISPKIVRGMTAQDILDLQKLKPLKTFEIQPGDSVPFAIVFLKSAKNAKDFTCEIVSADGEI
jgi:predicted Zn finger-like uncharacterized protein